EPQNITLEIIYEDEELLVINKPSNLIVHPGAGNLTTTILNGLLYKYPNSKYIPRAGIVHRLDKDTTGLMVIAKTLSTYYKLVEKIRDRKVIRIYEAICYGNLPYPNKIIEPIGRHPIHRTKMCVHPKGKPAETRFEIIKNYQDFTWLKLKLITGRTHQIRVHLSHIKHPIVGDQTYANNRNIKNEEIRKTIKELGRQALHAKELSFTHPISHKELSFTTELPLDIQRLLQTIEHAE
ncbi:MAG: RluA family pseudouridine synthase, partial [Legionellales bacterium]|nr:RluA family pseudouridine synthase [Legionellales bacterium]